MEIVDYSEKSFLVKGETKDYKEILKNNFGRWNPTLQGWIFSMKHKEEIKLLLQTLNNSKKTSSISSQNHNKTSKTTTIEKNDPEINHVFNLFSNYLKQKNIKIYLTDLISFNNDFQKSKENNINEEDELNIYFEKDSHEENEDTNNNFYLVFLDFFRENIDSIDFHLYHTINKNKLLEYGYLKQK